jgi:DNA modification methylase
VINHASAVMWLAEQLPGTVDLLYIDPPFNSGRTQVRGAISYQDDLPRSDYVTLLRTVVSSAVSALKPGGALWVHCDESADWLVRSVLEGEDRLVFQNSVVWNYYNKISNATRRFASAHDTLFLFAKRGAPMFFDPQTESRDKPARFLKRQNVAGKMINVRGEDGRCVYVETTVRGVNDVWRIPCLQPASREWTGYPTQKPEALLERVIRSTSRPGDLVVDPMCGSGTTPVVAARLGRRWAGSDESLAAVIIARHRIAALDSASCAV